MFHFDIETLQNDIETLQITYNYNWHFFPIFLLIFFI